MHTSVQTYTHIRKEYFFIALQQPLTTSVACNISIKPLRHNMERIMLTQSQYSSTTISFFSGSCFSIPFMCAGSLLWIHFLGCSVICRYPHMWKKEARRRVTSLTQEVQQNHHHMSKGKTHPCNNFLLYV